MSSSIWRAFVLAAVAAAALFSQSHTAARAAGDWVQWGGPGRNFMSDATGLASTWPPSGPRRLWTQPLGEGHSSILVEGGRLYTMYRPFGLLNYVRRSQEEVVVALDAASGKTIWEYRYAAPTDGVDFSYGAGPHSTPLIVGNVLYATSSRRQLFAIDKTTGKLLWNHDFMREYKAPELDRGFVSSPLAFQDTIVVSIGGPNQAVGAFDQRTGALVWKGGSAEVSPASQILISVDGQQQLVVFGGDRIIGMNPSNGQTLWSHPHRTDYGLNISTPVWSSADNLLFISAAYGSGSRVLELRQAAGKTSVAEKWYSNRMRVHIGKQLWQDRSFSRAQLLYADGKLIILDEDGALGLATVSPQGLKVLARATVLENVAWTPPTLSGTILYVRDRKKISAYSLGS
jgi:outer membrane protein assembly factor BamB